MELTYSKTLTQVCKMFKLMYFTLYACVHMLNTIYMHAFLQVELENRKLTEQLNKVINACTYEHYCILVEHQHKGTSCKIYAYTVVL